MNDKAFENKVNRDVDQAKKDFTTLGEDNVTGLASIKKDLVMLGDDGVTGLSRKFEQLANDTKEMVTDAVKTLNKDVGHGLSQYNAKVQDVADRVPGGFGEKAARYPWVAISIALAVGFLLGSYLKPARSKLTDDDLEKIGGKFDKLIDLLQERYGYTQQQAEEEYKKRTK
jgi:ElaB/YqjD/DUF883 family membrane-anchored ribosome-binding protein/uncharacterized protein YjbJ (UPF0337 family)